MCPFRFLNSKGFEFLKIDSNLRFIIIQCSEETSVCLCSWFPMSLIKINFDLIKTN